MQKLIPYGLLLVLHEKLLGHKMPSSLPHEKGVIYAEEEDTENSYYIKTLF